MVKYKGRIPKIGEIDAHDVPEDTYMFFEDQTSWSQKYLTHGWSEEVKMRGIIVASNPLIYSELKYYECTSRSVLGSTQYKAMYLQKHANNHPDLNDNRIREEFYVLKCNAEVIEQVDYNEHCNRLHGIKASSLK